ncbi:MAG: hypothetical protein AAF623_03335 [Planctomycetota bacterium]
MNYKPLIVGMLVLAGLVVGCGIKQSRIEAFVNNEKSNLPKMLFSGLEATDVQAGDSELIYVCRPKGIPEDVVKQKQNQAKDDLASYVKRNKTQLSSLIEYKIKLTIQVQGNGGDELFRVTVLPWEL